MYDSGDNEDGLKLLMEHPSSTRIDDKSWELLIRYAVNKGNTGCVALLLGRIDHKYIAGLVDIAR